MRLTLRFKGGKGSGDFGHKGRPGSIGGFQKGQDYAFEQIRKFLQSVS